MGLRLHICNLNSRCASGRYVLALKKMMQKARILSSSNRTKGQCHHMIYGKILHPKSKKSIYFLEDSKEHCK